MNMNKIHRISKYPRRADKSAMCAINDSVGKFCTDKRTRRTKDVLEEYERHEKQFENPFLLDEDADSGLSCFFRSFCSI